MTNFSNSPVRFAAVLLIAFASLPLFADEIAVQFDPARTKVNFEVGSLLHDVHGEFKLKQGSMKFDPATGKASGSIVVNAASGDSGGSARDRRMTNSILEAQKYPDITFAPDRVEGTVNPSGDSQVKVHGTFTIHGSPHEMTFPFVVHIDKGDVTASTEFSVPYQKWGMKNPSTLFLKVDDTVKIDIKASGKVTESVQRSAVAQ